MNFTKQPSCADDQDIGVLRVEQALAQMYAALRPLTETEYVPLRQALGRVLAQVIVCPINVPSHTNAAMDGYALRGADLPAEGSVTLRQIGVAWAGRPFADTVPAGQCVRIMTGACLPDGTDTVVMQENVRVDGDWIQISAQERPGQNVRHAGEDLACGEPVLSAGRLILPPELGLLASLGIVEVKVIRRLRVAFFSTGDELRSLGEFLQEGQIYDSNRYTIYGMLMRAGVEVIDMGVVRDDRAILTDAVQQAASHADVLITSGGVSVGEADFTKAVLSELGNIAFWKIAMKPGRPLAFGQVKNMAFLGLPGNPVAVMVTFYQFVLPLLRYLQGEINPLITPTIQAKSLFTFKKKPGRSEFPRGFLSQDETGQWCVEISHQQGSGILRSMSEGNCFILLPETQGTVAAGDWVTVQPFSGLL
ncbi:gephyrin-like molybdotransferase Glp [Thioflexithrix psekupsensis]|uniref:Molybdopterin molybdenumtransferase n=1 Tax=Thioflexithrix psekupsensis TaxID=1570016 RepID=A0A251XBI8_9GAMM|nr:gephyrin-like molybdotransferase Glp [Thioflexithrix psekupsensis]OUD15663.1 molybdopterin molybdenumtransferase MoeA [Thioflexithrix psekupsensis]